MIFWMFCLSAVFLIRGCAHLHRRSQGRSQRSWSLSLCRSNFSMFQFWSTILGGLTFQKWIWSKCQWRMLERPGILMDPLWGCAMLGCCWGSVQHWRMMLGTHFCLFSSNFKIVFSHQGFAHVSCYGSSASPSTSWVILASFTRDICSPLVVGKQLFHIISLEWGGIWGNSKISKALTALRSLASDQAELTDFFLYFMTSVEASTRSYHRSYHRLYHR